MRETTSRESRTPFLDNLRTLIVLLVIVFHSAASYGSAVDFWPFHDADPSKAIDLFIFVLDVFTMAVLFYIAGYFALPSLQKRGFARFCADKARRLALPWLAIILLVLPVLDYVNYRHSATGAPGVRAYGEHWLLSIRRMADFHVGWMNMSTYSDMTEHFYQRYMWYLSLLVLFFFVFALCHLIAGKAGKGARLTEKRRPEKRSVFLPLVFTAGVSTLLFGAVRFFLYPEFLDKGWFSLGNVVQFQLGKLGIYGCYFVLGIYSRSKGWFSEGNCLGRPWKWAVACFLLFSITMYALARLNSGPALLGLRLTFVVSYPLWVFSFLGLFLSTAAVYWNRSAPVSRSLSANSYNMYLAHYPVPMIMPLLLAGLAWMPGPAKFALVSLAALTLSYGASRFLIEPFPRATVAVLICLSITLALVT